MNAEITAATIIGSITVAGFFIQGLFITQYIDDRRKKATREIEEIREKNEIQLEHLKIQLSTEASQKLEEYKIALAELQKTRKTRHESLTLLLNMAADSDEAARDLCKFSEIEGGAERVRTVTKTLQTMSPFFEILSKSDPTKSLTKEDRIEAKRIQEQLVKMLLLMDFDRKDQEYRDALNEVYRHVAKSVEAFRLYVDNVIAE
jgi:hypothetical protein